MIKPVPLTYADTFRVLYENGILNKDLFETMEKVAKFRNIIVHHYDKVDYGVPIFDLTHEELKSDFENA